ncbi:uncharacterized protein L969DRAFT_65096 [Mixia osmundae IAM 14324]|uniref:rRNA-processing protein n=1 Tax=Mixia osmundae (strain CBS 9802 / IAM 14324 / JCM 22182 / KY 12970) TaxID=764103 RepID=G7DWR2_MIXOS|nr:uncharacterized protein L969DRAFT_55624 [Mixia osmundae IAM 14324]XP_014566738.1 uncharacterized protein L969DRAFT_65096 [Mixia osmundae IAM 14324]KEI36213.1 hypothetical protein L969DRAFT_55624 [Mixia osmundae IAM 14324]KEI38181.1 hypothetical protein L969DRAFT_65096 [Mixia osmundae IAM 14324]GAA95009.1 hypothetical protein E5Q_01664 [Mixia osmundae IAM 14324]
MAATASTSTAPEPKLRSNVSGRPWKQLKTATNRSQRKPAHAATVSALPDSLAVDGDSAVQGKPKKQSAAWQARMADKTKRDAIRKIEQELKDDKQADIDRRKAINTERKKILEDKRRIAEAAQKMSAKRLQRFKKKLGRTKKVNA